VPASAPAGKAIQIKIYGAKLVRVEGLREDVAKAAQEACRLERKYYGSHNINPYFLEGLKTFAYEVAEQMNWAVPDNIVFPVGTGGLIVGSWKGFDELLKLGWIESFPKLHCIQASACMPIVHAYQRGLDYIEDIRESETVAGGVRIRRPARGKQVLDAVRKTDGVALAVSDGEILHHQKVLAKKEGIFAEPTSCVALAGLAKLCENKQIDHDETVIVPITGFGLKDVETAKKQVGL
jgi:threonine synthase